MDDVFFTIILVMVGILSFRLLQKHLHEAKLLKLREMVHTERMRALERDLPMPEDDSDAIGQLLSNGPEYSALSVEARTARERLIRMAALCLGLTSLLGGIGLTFGLHFQSDSSVSGMWGIGLIPTLIGVGLILFVRLSRTIGQFGVEPQDGV
jgi:hypothetical protein